MKPQTTRETKIRRQAHAKAILKNITIRQAVYLALEQWVRDLPDDYTRSARARAYYKAHIDEIKDGSRKES